MSEKKAKDVENVIDTSEEEVLYDAPLLPGRTQKDIVVIVNGTTLQLKRGMTHKIKRKYYEALMNSRAQQHAILDAINDTKKRGEKPVAEM